MLPPRGLCVRSLQAPCRFAPVTNWFSLSQQDYYSSGYYQEAEPAQAPPQEISTDSSFLDDEAVGTFLSLLDVELVFQLCWNAGPAQQLQSCPASAAWAPCWVGLGWSPGSGAVWWTPVCPSSSWAAASHRFISLEGDVYFH